MLDSLFELYQQVYSYESAFYVILKKKDERVFDFLDKRPIEFPLNPNLGKLLRIVSKKAVQYILKRHEKGRSFKIVDTCVQELRNNDGQVTHKERTYNEQNVHLFLHEIFLINKEMSRQYHESQIELYIKFDQPKLLAFLMATDNYPPFKAAEMCRNAGLHRE